MNYVGKSFKHYKGNLYKVAGEAIHSETLEEMIIYVDQNDKSKVWVRPKEMFFETIIFEGREVPRFEAID
jgi:hypothetical protein